MSKNNNATFQDLRLYEFLKSKIEDTVDRMGREFYRIKHGRDITSPVRTTYGKRDIYVESWELLTNNEILVIWKWSAFGDSETESMVFPAAWLDDHEWKERAKEMVEAERAVVAEKAAREREEKRAQETEKRRRLYDELRQEFGEEG